jgi:hypothetical protein
MAAVAQHGHQLHGLAGAVDATLGVEEGVDGPRLVAAGDAAVGQVERRLGEFEAGEFLLGGVRGHHGTDLGGALALQQAGGEGDASVGGGECLSHRLVAARQQHDLEAGKRQGGLQRAGEDVQPVVAAEGRQRDVGVHHPHAGGRSARAVLLVTVVARRRLGCVPYHDEIGAGLPVLDRLADREGGGHRLVGDVAHLHGAAPLQGAVGAVQPAVQGPRFGDRLTTGISGVVAVAGEAVDRPLVHAIDGDADLGDVDGRDRQADGAAARQDEALAGQRHHRRPRAQGDVDCRLGCELDAVAAGEARQKLDLVVLTVGQAGDAEAIVDHAQRRFYLGLDAHIVGIGHAGRCQRLVEGQAASPSARLLSMAIRRKAGVRSRLGDRRRRQRARAAGAAGVVGAAARAPGAGLAPPARAASRAVRRAVVSTVGGPAD